MKLGELTFDLLFHSDTMKLKDFGRALGDLNMQSIFTAVGLGGVYEASKNIIDGLTATGDQLNEFSRTTGQSTDELQRWSRMAKEVGVSSETIAGTIYDLQTKVASLGMFGSGASPLLARILGVDPLHPGRYDYFTGIERLYAYFQRFKDLGQRNAMMQQLGIPAKLGNIFSLPRDKFFEGMKSAKTFSPDDLKKVADYQAAAADLSTEWKQTLGDIGVTFIPILTGLTKTLDAIDLNVIKSEKWAYLMSQIGMGLTQTKEHNAISDYGRLVQNIFGEGGVLDDIVNQQINPAISEDPMRTGLGPATLKNMSNISLTIRNNLKSNDPNTTVETSVDSSEGANVINQKTLRQAIGQQPAGTT